MSEYDGMSTQEWNRLSDTDKEERILGYRSYHCKVCNFKGNPNDCYLTDKTGFYCSKTCYLAAQVLSK